LKSELTARLLVLCPKLRTRNSEVLESDDDREKNSLADAGLMNPRTGRERARAEFIPTPLELMPWNDRAAPGRNEPDRPTVTGVNLNYASKKRR
jgi:hypothetical protein